MKKDTLINILSKGISNEQARAAVTTYCIFNDIEVDTKLWDDLMAEIWNGVPDWFNTFEELDNFMCGLLI